MIMTTQMKTIIIIIPKQPKVTTRTKKVILKEIKKEMRKEVRTRVIKK
jgi:hypothetical protein